VLPCARLVGRTALPFDNEPRAQLTDHAAEAIDLVDPG
jgi:hypothetical protein